MKKFYIMFVMCNGEKHFLNVHAADISDIRSRIIRVNQAWLKEGNELINLSNVQRVYIEEIKNEQQSSNGDYESDEGEYVQY
ncbi:hypothetical protein [Paenibacillus sp. RC84]|uniref:hypothetical protein n=1 Tax=Paenibacillus sp. RC84 TaxID=3156252 RepID=UPI0035116A6F